MNEDTASSKLTEEWDVRGIDVATLRVDTRGTIVPMRIVQSRATTPLGPESSGVTQLPELATGQEAGAELELGETLGEGGMGIVWAAKQMALRRDVAVKSVHPKAPQPHTTHALLREARVTGALEHPNVVPIHALGRDKEGRPLIVMKRIDGVSWADLLQDQSTHGPGAVMSHVEYHIGVLIDVAKAVHFAHSKGIVHRDIKPDNVMIGGFGEVYVVDWGIAVGLAGTELDLPRAADTREVTGSPAYMAPEMAIGDGPRIDERTDVYLLGATLHEIITGAPPHAAPSTVGMLTKAYASATQHYGAGVPSDLAHICHTAMSRASKDRHQTAAAFAAALQRFLKHRDSTLLTDEAAAKLESLRELLAVPTADKTVIYHLFNECRFGFTHALRIWDGNARARHALQRALELMIGYELEHGSAGAAAALLGELPEAHPKLAARVERKKNVESREKSELGDLKLRLDPNRADRPRAYVSFVVAITWPLMHALYYWVDTSTVYAIGHYELAAGYGLHAIGSLGIGLAARETFLIRALSGAQTQLTVTLCHAAVAAVWLVAASHRIELAATFALALFVAAMMWTTAAVAVDRRLVSWGLAMFAGLGATFYEPRYALLWMGAAGTIGSALLGWLRIRTVAPDATAPLSQELSNLIGARTQREVVRDSDTSS
jgi:serine/threonine-protein kinase